MDKYVQIMMKLIKSEITKTPLELSEELTDDDLKAVYTISKRHDLAHLTGYALEKNRLLPDNEIGKKFIKEKNLAIYRYFNLDSAQNEIYKEFEEAKIPFIPLKGSVIRELYPEPWMRTSCDADILVKEEDLDRAISLLVNTKNYTEKNRGSHDVSLYSSQNVHIELHYNLLEDGRANNAIKILNNVWENVLLEENCSYRYKMTDNFYYFYHIVHMAKHFEVGGCGVRPFADIWIFNHSNSLNSEKKYELLKKAELYDFSRTSEKLSEVWFGNLEHNELTRQVEEYILKSGAFGNTESMVSVMQAKKGNKAKQILTRFWLPYKFLKFRYPILQKYPFLVPFYQLKRWIEVLFNGRLHHRIDELKMINTVSKDSKQSTLSMLEQLGLK